MNRSRLAVILVIIALMIALAVCLMMHWQKGRSVAGNNSAKTKPLYWIDTMQPTVHYPGPGKSSMGMDLVPVYSNEQSQNGGAPTLQINPAIVDNLGIRIAAVQVGDLMRRIDTVGYVMSDETQISHAHVYVDGWIRNLQANETEQPIKKGQLLFQLYSPTLVNAQEEYLIALQSSNTNLIKASQQKLLALGVSDLQIQQLTQTRIVNQLVDVYSHHDGIVATLSVRQGMRVNPDMEIMSMIDLSHVWIVAEIYEKQAAWVRAGQSAEAKLVAYPNKVWQGRVDYVYLILDTTTRSLKARLTIENSEGILKPNMYASVSLLTEPKSHVLSIPREAVIRGSQGEHVIVSLGKGQFQVRAVTLGMESGDRVEILSGLSPGENIVISGQFLIDSEANLQSSFQRMDSAPAGAQ